MIKIKSTSSSSRPRKSKTARMSPRMASVQAILDQKKTSAVLPGDDRSVSSYLSSQTERTSSSTSSSARSSRSSKLSVSPLKTSSPPRHSLHFPRQHSQRSTTSQTSVSSLLDEFDGVAIDHHAVVAVTQLWDQLKAGQGYREDFAEQVVLGMLEVDPLTLQNLRLVSLRSTRFQVVSTRIFHVLETLILNLGPDIDEEDLLALGELCNEEGIHPLLLGEASQKALVHVLGEDCMNAQTSKVWKATLYSLATGMANPVGF